MSRNDGQPGSDAKREPTAGLVQARPATSAEDQATENLHGRSPGNASFLPPHPFLAHVNQAGQLETHPASTFKLLHYVEHTGIPTPDGIGLVKTREWHADSEPT